MDRKRTLLNFFFGLLCTAAISAAVPFLLYYGFDLTASPLTVFSCTLLFSLLFSMVFFSGKTFMAFVVTLLGVTLLLWDSRAAQESFILFAKSITNCLLGSFDSFSHLESKLVVDGGTTCNHVLGVIGGSAAAFTSIGVFSKKHTKVGVELLPAATISVIALMLTIVQSVAAVPPWPVLLLCGAWVLLILTERCQYVNRGFWQWLAIPAAVFAILCFALGAPMNHDRTLVSSYTSNWQSTIFEFSPIKPTEDGVRIVTPRASQSLGNSVWNKHLTQSDLTRVGPNPYSDTQVMSVRSDSPGWVYLRGNSLGVYSGISWKAIDEEEYDGLTLDETLFVKNGDTGYAHMTVRTAHDCQMAYVPSTLTSMPAQMIPYLDSYLANPQRLTAYSMDIHPMYSSQLLGRYALPEGYEEFVYQNYLQIPDSTAEFLKDYWQAPESGDISDILDSIGAKLARDKSYDRQTRRMTRGSGDFVAWFLSQSETGYCIHFASAGVMMLRSCGIPARLVNGFLTYADSDRWTVVNQGDAHAWVEYYVDGEGWYIYDPTPAADGDGTFAAPVEIETPVNSDVRNTSGLPGTVTTQTVQKPVKKETDHHTRMVVLACIIALYILWYFGLKVLRHVQFRNSDLNKRTIAIYRWIVMISRIDGVIPPESATDIALKARFSGDGVSAKEAEEMLRIYGETCERMHIYSEFWRAFAANYLLAI